MVESEFTSIHMLVLITSLLVIRVLTHMTQVFSTAHTYLSRWFAPLVRMTSNHVSGSRLVMAWRQTLMLVILLATTSLQYVLTSTTESSALIISSPKF